MSNNWHKTKGLETNSRQILLQEKLIFFRDFYLLPSLKLGPRPQLGDDPPSSKRLFAFLFTEPSICLLLLPLKTLLQRNCSNK